MEKTYPVRVRADISKEAAEEMREAERELENARLVYRQALDRVQNAAMNMARSIVVVSGSEEG